MTLKVGILNAIDPQLSQIDWQNTPFDGYRRFLESANPGFTYAEFKVALGEFPESVDVCDAYVITGSPRGVYDDDLWIGQLKAFIRDCYAAGKKLVGICFGHQVLAHALGGYTEKSEKGWGLGLKTFAVSAQKPWMTDPPGSYALYFAHQDQVQRLPAGAELLGGNEFCPIGMFVIGDQVLGVQGHPEFSERMMAGLVDNADGKMPPEFIETVRVSMQDCRPDNDTFGRWIVNFMLN